MQGLLGLSVSSARPRGDNTGSPTGTQAREPTPQQNHHSDPCALELLPAPQGVQGVEKQLCDSAEPPKLSLHPPGTCLPEPTDWSARRILSLPSVRHAALVAPPP